MCGLGALWAALWTPIGLGMVLVQMMLSGFGWPSWSLLGFLAFDGLRNGFIAGFLFAGGLGIAFRNKSFAELRTGAIAAVGALAGVVLPAGSMLGMAAAGFFVPPPITVAVTLLFGAGMRAATAVGSLKIAQAAPAQVGADSSSAGLLGCGPVDTPHPPPEVDVDVESVERLLAYQHPGLTSGRVVLMDEGWDNFTGMSARRRRRSGVAQAPGRSTLP